MAEAWVKPVEQRPQGGPTGVLTMEWPLWTSAASGKHLTTWMKWAGARQRAVLAPCTPLPAKVPSPALARRRSQAGRIKELKTTPVCGL